MTTLEVLREGRRRIAEVGWCQGDFTIPGNSTNYQSAVAFCAAGALMGLDTTNARLALGSLWSTLGLDQPIAIWNDVAGRTREDVLALYDATIARLEEADGSEGKVATASKTPTPS